MLYWWSNFLKKERQGLCSLGYPFACWRHKFNIWKKSAGFLGVLIKHNSKAGFLNMTQKCLINHVLKTYAVILELQMMLITHLPKGSPLPNMFIVSLPLVVSTISVVGMFLYIACNPHTDIAYAMNCATRYVFCPKVVNNHVLKQIGHYLVDTANKWYCETFPEIPHDWSFLDADFSGMYGKNKWWSYLC